jgi:multidrug efflux pump subunit AcrA (membrane-fusion protein)
LEFIEDAVIDYDRNPTGGTMMRVRVPNNDAALLAGLDVRVRYAISKPHLALLVPVGARNTSMWGADGRNPVWVVGDDNAARLRLVRASSFKHDDLLEITEGLKADEWIVCNANQPQLVRDGTRIKPKRVP